MDSTGKWYVRNTDGRVFGPIGFDVLCEWVKDGRVEPLSGVSNNLSDWVLAPLVKELEMDWVVENNPGQFYGPTHRNVIDGFLASGNLAPGARFYHDDRGRGDDALRQAQAEAAASETRAAEAENALKASREETAAAAAERDAATAERDALAAERDALAAERDALLDEVGKLRKEKESVHAREWKTEVLMPEVVVSDEAPPQSARSFFGQPAARSSKAAPFTGTDPSSLAALERQAQAELARMGADGAKRFFSFGKKK